ncbi:MAG: hypothetical protein U1E53_22955 [Dongiaceae bacterium]
MRNLRSLILPAAAAATLALAASAALADSDGRTAGMVYGSPANDSQSAAVPVFSDVPDQAPRSFDPRYPYKGRRTTANAPGWVDCQDPANGGLDRCTGLK